MAVFLLWGLSSPDGQLDAKGSKTPPEAVVDQTSATFSPAIAGSVVTHTFRIRNTGDVELNISGVHTE